MTTTIPLPTSPLARYREFLKEGQLAYQVDSASGTSVFYPRVVAPQSGNTLDWKVSRGTGTVYATTTISPKSGLPYNVALVDMDEGFRLMSRVESIDAAYVLIGMRVRARIHHPAGEESPYPVFDPLEAA